MSKTRALGWVWLSWICMLFLLSGCGAAMEAKSAGSAAPYGPSRGNYAEEAPPEPVLHDPSAADTGIFQDNDGRTAMTPDAVTLPAMAGAPPPPPPPPPMNQPAPQGGEASPSKPRVMEQASPSSRGPILIYTAQITMAVFEVQAALGQIEDLARELGGFLARRDNNSITIRVPAVLFDTAIRKIEKTGDVLNRNVVAQDVTEEYRDLELRIRNARAVRDRLEQLLAKAAKVEESVMVERELERVSAELERMEGRLKFLRDRAAYSTITVTYQPKQRGETTQTPFRLPVYWLNELGISRLLSL